MRMRKSHPQVQRQLQQQQQQQQQGSPSPRGQSPQRSQELPEYGSAQAAAPQRHYAMHVSVGLAALCAWWYYLQDVPALERKLLSVLLTPVGRLLGQPRRHVLSALCQGYNIHLSASGVETSWQNLEMLQCRSLRQALSY